MFGTIICKALPFSLPGDTQTKLLWKPSLVSFLSCNSFFIEKESSVIILAKHSM